MMKDLNNKANYEKYFQSIRFFYHSLPIEKKHNFLRQVAFYNIYLAAQCVMSSQKDEIIEEELILKAEFLAKDFNDPDNSARGFLALAEFEQFILISKLLKNVQKPTKQHLTIFKKIFENNNGQEIFFQLLDVLLDLRNIQLISYCVTTYNGTIVVNSENQRIINILLLFLFENGNYGLAKIIIEKYDLYNDIKLIFDVEPLKIVEDLLKANRKKLQAIKLAYEIYNRYNLIKHINAEDFINVIVGSDKGLVTAISIATRQHINSKQVNEKISNLLNPKRGNQKAINRLQKKVTQLINNGLLIYISRNVSLTEQFERFKEALNYDYDKKKSLLEIPIPIFISTEYSIYDDNVEIPLNKSIEEIVDDYFKMKKKPYLENLVNMLSFHFKASFKEISHALRKYELSGKVKVALEYGYYVMGENIETKSLFFLHPAQAFEINDINNHLEEGSNVDFRIIGINRTTLRFNISRLKEFQI